MPTMDVLFRDTMRSVSVFGSTKGDELMFAVENLFSDVPLHDMFGEPVTRRKISKIKSLVNGRTLTRQDICDALDDGAKGMDFYRGLGGKIRVEYKT